MWVAFLRSFPGKEAHKLFSGGLTWRTLGGAKNRSRVLGRGCEEALKKRVFQWKGGGFSEVLAIRWTAGLWKLKVAVLIPFPKMGVSFCWYRDVFCVVSRWPKSPFWYRDLVFGIEILHSVVQYLDRLLLGINLCVLFCLDILQIGGQKRSRYRKEDQNNFVNP